MIESSLLQFLTNAAPVYAITGDRIYLGIRPQNERRACVVLNRMGTNLFPSSSGTSKTTKAFFQIDALGPTYQAAKELGKALFDVLDGFKGYTASTRFRWVEVYDISDLPTAPLEGKATPTFGVSLQVKLMADDQ